MNRLLLLLVLLLAGGLRPACADLVIGQVTVLPFTGDARLQNADVLVTGDRIVAIGPTGSLEIPPETSRIDGRGRFLMPGLAEMHGHLPRTDRNRQYLDDVLFLYVARGITTVRGMLGLPGHLALKDEIAAGAVVVPTLYLAGPGFSGGNVASPEEAAARVRRQKQEGWDLLKIYPGLTRAEFDAIADAAREVDIPFAGHVPKDVGIEHALASGMRTIEHMDGYMARLGGGERRIDAAILQEWARRTREAGVGVVPTMAVWEVLLQIPDLASLDAYPELAYMPPEVVRQWHETQANKSPHPLKRFLATILGGSDGELLAENRCRLLAAMAADGVELLFGVDAPQRYSVPGFAVLREMRRMAECGMTFQRVLETATAAPGAYFRDRDRFGVIAEGARADLLLLDADPTVDLETLSRPLGVVLRGRWLPAAEIDARLAEIAERNRR